MLTFFFDCGVMMYFMPGAPLGALAAGYAGEHPGIRAALGWIGAGGVALAIGAARSRTLRAPSIAARP